MNQKEFFNRIEIPEDLKKKFYGEIISAIEGSTSIADLYFMELIFFIGIVSTLGVLLDTGIVGVVCKIIGVFFYGYAMIITLCNIVLTILNPTNLEAYLKKELILLYCTRKNHFILIFEFIVVVVLLALQEKFFLATLMFIYILAYFVARNVFINKVKLILATTL